MKTIVAESVGRGFGSAWFAWGMFLAFITLAGAEPACPTIESCAAHCAAVSSAASDKTVPQDLADRWGIEVTAIRLSAHGNMIDFRYRVLDTEKASVLGDPSVKPVLIDHDNGAQLRVPSMPKVGQMRSTAQRLHAGRIYTALFANPGGTVKKGHKVTVVFGDFRAEGLTVGE